MNKYTIKAPGSYSNSPKGLLWKPVGCFFDVSLNIQEMEVGKDPNQQHKIFGFSRGHHHKNSYRLGFIYTEQKLLLTAYVYNNGVKPYPEPSVITWLNLSGTEQEVRITSYIYISKDNRLNILGDIQSGNRIISFGHQQKINAAYLFPIGYKLGFAWGDNYPTTKDKNIIVHKLTFL